MAAKHHGDKIFGLSPDGTLSSFDTRSSQVCWSLGTDIMALNGYNKTSENNHCYYFVDSSSRVFKFTTGADSVGYGFHSREVCNKHFKYFHQDIVPSKLVGHVFVDPVKARPITPSTSECDEILVVRAVHAQLTSYIPETNFVLWYARVATVDIFIVSRKEGVALQRQQEQHTRSRRSMVTPPKVITNEIIPNVPQEVVDLLYSVAISSALSCKNLSRLGEAIIKSVDDCKELSSVTQTSFGPYGTNKFEIVIKHQNKLFLNELEIQHRLSKVLVLAAKEQQKIFGDGANLVVLVAGQHLEGAKELIKMGMGVGKIINGYRKASNKLGEILEGLVEEGSETMDVRDKDEVILRMKAPVASKQYGHEDILCRLIAEACIQVCPKNPSNFNVDNVRVARLLGRRMRDSKTFRGMVLKGDTLFGSIKSIEKAKVLVIAGGVDTTVTDTKGSVIIHSDEQLESYAKTEEEKVKELIKAVAPKVIVSGAALGEMALRLGELYKIMVLKIASESELDCFCRTTNAVDLLQSTVDHYLGYVDSISFETRSDRVIVTNEQGGVTTLMLGASSYIMNGLKRAVDQGVNAYKALCNGGDSRIVPGAGATEIEIAIKLKAYSSTKTGSNKNAIAKYAEIFELIPKTLAENAFLDATDIVSTLKEEHESGNVKVGIDLEERACKDVSTLKIWDLYTTKYHALKYAVDAVCDVLGLAQTIMSKRAVVEANEENSTRRNGY